MFKTSTVTFFCKITFSSWCFIWIIIVAAEKSSQCGTEVLCWVQPGVRMPKHFADILFCRILSGVTVNI